MLQLVVLLCLAPTLASSLKCWIGWQNWSVEPAVDNVRLAECQSNHTCCAFVSSLNGRQFGCHETCPPKNYRQCGPDPKSGIQDLRYCYCRSHHDPKCTPFLESWDKRAKLTTPMPPELKRTMFKDRFGPKAAMKSPLVTVKEVAASREGASLIAAAPPSFRPLPPGVLPPAMIPRSAAPPGAVPPAAAARARQALRKPAPPSGKPLRSFVKKTN